MEEADSGESDSPMESERSEDRAQRNRGPPGSREDISRAGAELTEAEQAMQVSSELPRDVTARAPSASIVCWWQGGSDARQIAGQVRPAEGGNAYPPELGG